jgi:hypothetical protein
LRFLHFNGTNRFLRRKIAALIARYKMQIGEAGMCPLAGIVGIGSNRQLCGADVVGVKSYDGIR